MTQHYPGPYEVELFYTESGITHKMRLNCDLSVEAAVGDPFANFAVSTRAAASVALNTAVTAFVTLLQPLFSTTTNFTIANLWKYVPLSNEKDFLSTYDVNLLGTVGTAQLTRQTIQTYRTSLGGPMRIVLMENNLNSNAIIPIRDAGATYLALANFLTGSSNWILARDGGWPTGKLNQASGINDAIERQRYR